MKRYFIFLSALVLLACGVVYANGNLFENGFETDSFSGWTKTDAGNILTIVSTSGLSMIGNWCLKEAGNGSATANVQSSSFSGASTDYYIRFYLRTDTLNGVSTIVGNMNDGGANVAVNINASNQVRLLYQSQIVCSTAISTNTTYRVEFHESINASTGGYELELNGSSCGTDFTRNTSSYSPTSFTLGGSTAFTNAKNVWYDQLGVGNVTWLGPYVAPTNTNQSAPAGMMQ